MKTTLRLLIGFLLPWLFLSPAASAQSNPLSSPACQEIKRAYLDAKKQADAARVKKLKDYVAQKLAEAKALLAEKKRAGNISGIAVGTKSVEILEQLAKQMDDKGTFEVPAQVRRELTGLMEECAKGKQKIEDDNATAQKDLDSKYTDLLAQKLKEAGAADLTDVQLAESFRLLISGRIPAAVVPSGTNAAPAAQQEPAVELEPAQSEMPADTNIIVRSSGNANNWVRLANWFADVRSIEIIEIPLLDRRQAERKTAEASAIGQPYETRYVPARVLPQGEPYIFQVRSKPGYELPDVEIWPTRRNNWTMTVRARPRFNPSRHGMEIFVSFPGVENLPAAAADTTTGEEASAVAQAPTNAPPVDNTPTVRIKVNTTPDGASVLVDGSPCTVSNALARTPCVVPMKIGTRQVRLRKLGYVDAVLNKFEAAEGKSIAYTLEKDPGMIDRTFKVSARTPWQNSGVTVKKGDLIMIQTTGTWNCGTNKEPVDAVGYTIAKYFFYYFKPENGPRQLTTENYGALLVKIGKDGLMRAVGKDYKATADADGNMLFDINETDDNKVRRDNGGTLTVHIQKVPPAPPAPPAPPPPAPSTTPPAPAAPVAPQTPPRAPAKAPGP